jgi:hypothetical protein
MEDYERHPDCYTCVKMHGICEEHRTVREEYFIETNFQAGGNSGDDVRNVWRREGNSLRAVGRIINKEVVRYWQKCISRGPKWNPQLTPLYRYLTSAQRTALRLENYDGTPPTIAKCMNYNLNLPPQ